MECPLDGQGKRGKHNWQWVFEDTPEGRVWTDRLKCNYCLVERQMSHAEDDVLIERAQS